MRAKSSGLRAKSKEKKTKDKGLNDIELTEEEKVVMDLLKASSPIDLNELKAQSGLSNKKWDKAIKGLTKNNLARVKKTEDGLFFHPDSVIQSFWPKMVRAKAHQPCSSFHYVCLFLYLAYTLYCLSLSNKV